MRQGLCRFVARSERHIKTSAWEVKFRRSIFPAREIETLDLASQASFQAPGIAFKIVTLKTCRGTWVEVPPRQHVGNVRARRESNLTFGETLSRLEALNFASHKCSIHAGFKGPSLT
jgi:hypothetical protein